MSILGSLLRRMLSALPRHLRAPLLVLLFLPLPLAAQEEAPSCNVGIKSADTKTYVEALAHYNSHNYRQAALLLRRVAQRNPKAPEPQFYLGMTAVYDGFNATAIRRYFSRCISLCPSFPNPLAHYYMAVIHYTDGHYADAIRELDLYFLSANQTTDREINAVYESASNYLYWSQFLEEAIANTVPFDPHIVPGVSSPHNEALPYLSPDGRSFYYLREVPEEGERTFYHRDVVKKHWRLFCSTLSDSTFSRGTELPPPFNSGSPEGSLSLTADGSELYFSIIKPSAGYANSDLYLVRRTNGRWTEPENLGPIINGPRTWESQPSVSADGQTLIFASDRQGSLGGTDLWRCHRLKDGGWSRPENLGDAVNTVGNEKAPFLAADGHTLYFLSNGWQGFGGYDIYFTDLSDPYGNRPTNLGLPINSEADEISIGVSTDGRQAYFASKLEGSRSTDILLFDLYPAARPEPMTLRPLTLLHDGLSTDTLLILPSGKTHALLLSAPGCLPAVLSRRPSSLPSSVSLSDSVGLLEADFLPSSLLSPEGEAAVDALAAWLIAHPRIHIVVESPRAAESKAIYSRLLQAGLRSERLSHRSGTAIKRTQIRLP